MIKKSSTYVIFVLTGRYAKIRFEQINRNGVLIWGMDNIPHENNCVEISYLTLALAKKHDNVMLELTYTLMTRGVIEFFVRELGSERVFFGTDLPMRDPGPQIAWVVFAEIPLEDKLNILGLNMKRLLERVLPDKCENDANNN